MRKCEATARLLLAPLGVIAGGLAAPQAVAQCYYTYVQIPNPPGLQHCRASSINSLGHVTGIIASLSENYRSFIWTPEGGRVDLPMPTGVSSLIAHDINDLGHVCGSMIRSGALVAFLWDGAHYTIIEPPAWANGIEAVAINNLDQVTGTVSNNITGPLHVFVWHAGAFVDVGAGLGEIDSFGRNTNELGLVAASAYGPSPNYRGFVWESSFTWLPHPSQLDRSDVVEMSNNGFFVGNGNTEEPVQFFGIVWTPWGTSVISAPPEFRDARMRDVNDAGRAVGVCDRRVGGGGGSVSIVWQAGNASDLNALVSPSAPPGLKPQAINNAGQIAATHDEGTVILNPVWLPGDLTGDCHVGIADLGLVLSNFGAPLGSYPMGDVDVNGQVDLADLAILLSHWGE